MHSASATDPQSFARFGDLLRFLRRRAQLTQRELSIAVGYNFAQICRLEQGQRLPDPAVVAATFIPALELADEPAWAARLIALAEAARRERRDAALSEMLPSAAPAPPPPAESLSAAGLEAPPAPPRDEVLRPRPLERLRVRLVADRRVALCGLPGMGKTTLAAAIARERAAPVFWLTLTSGVTTSVEAVLRQLALFALAHGQPQVQPLLQEPVGAPLPLDRQLGLLGAALSHIPDALLCFDNLHLVQHDDAVMLALRHLAATTPVQMLFTSRESALGIPGCAELRLEGLEAAEGQKLIAQLVALRVDEPSPPWAEALLERTGGSPMLLHLAVGQLLDEQATPAAFVGEIASHSQIGSYLLETVRRHTSPQAWELLAFVSLFRQPVNLLDPALAELLEQAGFADLGAPLAELTRRYLIDSPERARPHRLVGDYAASTLAAQPARRRQFHRLAAEWLEQWQGAPLEAAHHYREAAALADAAAVLAEHTAAFVRGGQAFLAADLAGALLEQARRQRGADELARRLLLARGDLLVHTLRADEAESAYREALLLTTGVEARARINVRLAVSLAERGQAAEAAAICHEAARRLDETNVALLAQLSAAEAQARLLLLEAPQATAAARKALALADQLDASEPTLAANTRVDAHRVLGTLLRYRHNHDAALGHFRQATRAAQLVGAAQLVARCRTDEARLLFTIGDLLATLQICEELAAELQASGDSYTLGEVYALLAMSHLLCGQPQTGLAYAQRGYALRDEIGDAHGLVLSANNCALLLIALNRVPEARSLLERALASYDDRTPMPHLGLTLDKLAMVELIEGDAPAAVATLQRALWHAGAAHDTGMREDVLHDMAVAHLVQGELAEAQQLMTIEVEQNGRWLELERLMISGLVALAADDPPAATDVATNLRDLAERDGFRLYVRRAERLAAAARRSVSMRELPRLLWVDNIGASAEC